MTDQDRRAFAIALGVVAEVFGETLSPTRIEAYFVALAGLPIEVLEAACRQAVQRLKFFPRPAELLEIVHGSIEERAALAWGRVRNAANGGWGGYTPIDFEDPALHATVAAMGGWGRFWSLGFRDTEPVDLATARKEFMSLYPGFLLRGAPAETPAALCAERGTGHLAARVVPALLGDLAPRAYPDESTGPGPKAITDGRAGALLVAPDVRPIVEQLARAMDPTRRRGQADMTPGDGGTEPERETE